MLHLVVVSQCLEESSVKICVEGGSEGARIFHEKSVEENLSADSTNSAVTKVLLSFFKYTIFSYQYHTGFVHPTSSKE